MANPQIKDGYIKIVNSISWAFEKIRISGEEYQCLWVILNMTYGWNKKTRPISLKQFTVRTGIKKPNIIRALQKLINKNLIVIKKDNKKTVSYGLNKNYETWKPLSKKITLSKKKKNVGKKDNTKCSNDLTDNKLQPPKDIFKKDNYIYTKNFDCNACEFGKNLDKNFYNCKYPEIEKLSIKETIKKLNIIGSDNFKDEWFNWPERYNINWLFNCNGFKEKQK